MISAYILFAMRLWNFSVDEFLNFSKLKLKLILDLIPELPDMPRKNPRGRR